MKITLTLLIVISSILSFSQKKYEGVKISLTEIKQEQSKTAKLLKIYNYKNSTIILKKEAVKGPGGWMYYIQEYNQNQTLVKSTKVNPSLKSMDDFSFEEFLQIDDHFVLIYKIDNKKNRKLSTYIQIFETATAKFSKPEEIHSLEYLPRQIHRVYLSTKVSANKKSFAINFTTKVQTSDPLSVSNEINKSFFAYYDSESRTIFKENYVIKPNDNGAIIVTEFSIDDSGNLFLILAKAQYILNGRTLKKSVSNFSIKKVKGDDFETFEDLDNELDLDGSISYLQIIQTKQGNHFISGLYETDEGQGNFYSRINLSNGELTSINKCEFALSFINEVELHKYARKEKTKKNSPKITNISNLIVTDIIENSNNSIIVINEAFYEEFHYSDQGKLYHNYHFSNYIVTYFKENGETPYNYYHKYSKNFQNTNFIMINDAISFIGVKRKVEMVNKPEVELTKAEKKKLAGYVLGFTTINDEGELNKRILIDYSEELYKSYIRPKEIKSISTKSTVDGSIEFNLLTNLKESQFGFLNFIFD